jgi:hypothetical protein
MSLNYSVGITYKSIANEADYYSIIQGKTSAFILRKEVARGFKIPQGMIG